VGNGSETSLHSQTLELDEGDNSLQTVHGGGGKIQF